MYVIFHSLNIVIMVILCCGMLGLKKKTTKHSARAESYQAGKQQGLAAGAEGLVWRVEGLLVQA